MNSIPYSWLGVPMSTLMTLMGHKRIDATLRDEQHSLFLARCPQSVDSTESHRWNPHADVAELVDQLVNVLHGDEPGDAYKGYHPRPR